MAATWGRPYAEELAAFSKLHVRVCIKGCDPEHFSTLTGSRPEGFEYQMRALENLRDAGSSFHPALMAPGATAEQEGALVERLRGIDKGLVRDLETEEVTMYPHVRRRCAELVH